MATATVQEEVGYESDPEEVKRSLAMRRREASDDEEGEGVGDNDNLRVNRRAEILADESDGQGGVAEYDDYEEEGFDIEDAGEEERGGYDEEEEDIDEEEVDERRENVKGKRRGESPAMEEMEVVDGMRNIGEAMEGHAADYVEEEEGKEKEPFAVPTAGAFYMHDDRFQDNAGGQHRRVRGGKKLWESKDNRKWGHDKFEEMNTQERQYEERRKNSRGRYGGRGRTRGQERGNARGRSSSSTFNINGNQNQAPKVVTRGRGPRRYETTMKRGIQAASKQNKQSRNSRERASQSYSRGALITLNSTEAAAAVQTKKITVASSLSSTSPPFYPTASSSNSTQEIEVGMEKLDVNESALMTGKNCTGLQMPSSGSLSVGATPSSQLRGQGRGTPVPGKVIYQSAPPTNQVDRAASPTQPHAAEKGNIQTHAQPSAKAYETGALVAKGKDSLQVSGRGSFLYSGTQVMCAARNPAVGHGDQNFPAFLPVMQFGGQHPGGVGLPAFGMAFPGYVAQSQHGLGNSEMTWLPFLTGAGTIGATYCSPFAPIDGAYSARSSGQPSSVGSSSKENNINKPDDESKPLQRSELTNNEFTQQQNNPNKQPRRYSEMSFSK